MIQASELSFSHLTKWCWNTSPFFDTYETRRGRQRHRLRRPGGHLGRQLRADRPGAGQRRQLLIGSHGRHAGRGRNRRRLLAGPEHLAAHPQHPRIDGVLALGRRAVDGELRRQLAGGERLLDHRHGLVPRGVVGFGQLLVFVVQLLEGFPAAAQAIGVGHDQPVVCPAPADRPPTPSRCSCPAKGTAASRRCSARSPQLQRRERFLERELRTWAATWPLTAAEKSFSSTALNVLPPSVDTSTASAPAASPRAWVMMYGLASATVTTPGWPLWAGTSDRLAYLTFSAAANDCRTAVAGEVRGEGQLAVGIAAGRLAGDVRLQDEPDARIVARVLVAAAGVGRRDLVAGPVPGVRERHPRYWSGEQPGARLTSAE